MFARLLHSFIVIVHDDADCDDCSCHHSRFCLFFVVGLGNNFKEWEPRTSLRPRALRPSHYIDANERAYLKARLLLITIIQQRIFARLQLSRFVTAAWGSRDSGFGGSYFDDDNNVNEHLKPPNLKLCHHLLVLSCQASRRPRDSCDRF